VRFLRKRLENLKVVDQRPADPGKVYFGAWVTLEDENGDMARYRIVGPDEIDLKLNLISIDSPLARALVGKGLDAEVQVHTPTGARTWYVVEIDYP
jgi:transcription elongation factor GreB